MQEYTLDNGLKILFLKKPKTYKVRAQIAYKFGSNHETSDSERGLAHVVEHMIFKGTHSDNLIETEKVRALLDGVSLPNTEYMKRSEVEAKVKEFDRHNASSLLTQLGALYLSEADIDSIGRLHGASLNAFTSLEKTSYYFETGKGNIDPFLQIFANSAQNSSFKDDHINSEIKAVLQELKMGNDNPVRMAIQKTSEMIYGVSEKGHLSTIGSELDLMKLNHEVVTSFYEKNYHPHNATLFVVGDFKPDLILPKIKSYFEHIGVDNYKCKQAVDALKKDVYHPDRNDETCREAITQTMTNIDALSNRPFRKSLLAKCHEMSNALDSKAYIHSSELEHVVPSPAKQEHRMYENVKQPTYVFSWRIPGYNNKNKLVSRETCSALDILTSAGSQSRLYQALVKTNLASSAESFSDQYHHAGIFFVIVTPFSNTSRKTIEDAIDSCLTSPITDTETERITNVMRNSWHEMHENVSELTNNWVYDYLATGDASHIQKEPCVSTEHVQDLMSHLILDTVNVVTIHPMNEKTSVLWKQRQEQRERNAQNILQIKNRITPLEETHSLHLCPPVTPLKALIMPEVMAQKPSLWKNDLVLLHPTSKRLHYRKTCRNQVRNLEALTMGIAMECLKEEVDTAPLDQQGVSYSFGSSGVGMTFIGDDPDLVSSSLSKLSPRTCVNTEKLEQIKGRYADFVNRSKESAQALAMNELKNVFSRKESYSLDDAKAHIMNISLQDVNDQLKSFFFDSNTMVSLARVAKHQVESVTENKESGRFPTPDEAYAHAYTDPITKHLPLDRNQTVLVLARPGYMKTVEKDSFLVQNVLYHICFHSLGSRIYKIRERTGLFYGARGLFGCDADSKHVGYDYISTRVEPTDVEKTKTALLSLCKQMHTNPNITQNELNAAKRWVENTWVSRISSPAGMCSTIESVCRKHPNEHWKTFPSDCIQQANACTVEEINALSRKVFRANWDVCVTVG
jgi:predicted Zn-dependent peptidase